MLPLKTLVCGVALALAGCGFLSGGPTTRSMSIALSGLEEVPPQASAGSGRAEITFSKETQLLRWTITYAGLSGPVTFAHFHGPAAASVNGPVVLPFKGSLVSPVTGSATLTPEQAGDLLAGRWYVNLHTAAHPSGEIRGQLTADPTETPR